MRSLLDSLRQAWLVVVLAVAFGIALAGVHLGLRERIAANQRAEILEQIPSLVLGPEVSIARTEVGGESMLVTLAGGEWIELAVRESQVAGRTLFAVERTADGEPAGWVVRGSGQGYADVIDLLIGIGPQGQRITGLYVVAQKETPGLGDAITRRWFHDRFVGAAADRRLEVTRDPGRASPEEGRVLAISAATISSQSVAEIVNRTLEAALPVLQEADR